MRDVCGIIQGVTGKEIKPIYLIKAFGLLMEDSEVGRQEKPQDRNVLYNYIDPDAGILRLNTARPPLDQNSLVPQGWSGTVISFIRQGMIGVERDMELPPLLIGHFQDGSTKHVHRNGRWNWKIQGIARKPKTDAEKSIHWNVFKL